MKLGHVALDGTKANASKRKAMSYERMGEAEKKLEEEVKALLEEARVEGRLKEREQQEAERGRKFCGRRPRRRTRSKPSRSRPRNGILPTRIRES